MPEMPELKYYGDVVEFHGKAQGDKPHILFEDDVITFKDYCLATRRVANGFVEQGARPGDGVAILVENCPEYLYVFHGVNRAGLYSVPVNRALKGDGLQYILTHSDVRYLVVDDTWYARFKELEGPVGAIEKVFLRRTGEEPLSDGALDLQTIMDASEATPTHEIDPEAIAYIQYTSGTTGFPKGVVTRNGPGGVQQARLMASAMVQPNDILYTCLPLFHANALFLTAGMAMNTGGTFGLDRRFSASRFWDNIRRYKATKFNALGAMIPILMKQPEKPEDADNSVTLVMSAACPANLWQAFEKRFGLTIWEGYGAVDGAGVSMMNMGTAPVGSVGKPNPGVEWKLADDDDNEVPRGEIGELIVKVVDRKVQNVEYFKNPEASEGKTKGGWVRTGDLFWADKDGNLYFADRKTDSMRRRGENISSWEVEKAVEKHPAVATCAAFGVPSELTEDEVMIWVVPANGAEVDCQDLMNHCAKNLAYFMVPRYVDIVSEIPSTGTLRVQKSDMKKRGVTDRTWDREKEMPDLELKK